MMVMCRDCEAIIRVGVRPHAHFPAGRRSGSRRWPHHGKIISLHSVRAINNEITVKSESRKHAQAYLAGLALAGAFEIEELRRTPAELKLRQIWSLMTAASLLESDAQRQAEIAELRERWRLIRQAFP